jgi:hypothetical protein
MFFWRDPFYRELRAFPAMSAYIRAPACMGAMYRMTGLALLRKPQCVPGANDIRAQPLFQRALLTVDTWGAGHSGE